MYNLIGKSSKKAITINGRRNIVMKSTGIVRDVDNLGRIVLPIELRRTLGINVKDSVEIFTDNDGIILKRFQQACVFCSSTDGLTEYKGKMVCAHCIKELNASK